MAIERRGFIRMRGDGAKSIMSIPQIQWTVSVGSIILAGSVLSSALVAARVVKRLIHPIKEFISEHDVLWEDYNLRTGGDYRRSTGRGGPPDPEEFYRDHRLAHPPAKHENEQGAFHDQ
jgi:hypothetical protein